MPFLKLRHSTTQKQSLLKRLTHRLTHNHNADLFSTDRAILMGDSYPDRPSDHGASDGTSPAPTIAAFSPNQQTVSRTKNQKSVLIHQKSPLLVATPPQVTRALAYSHPFILPLNHVVGLLSWTTHDPWESFLLVACFWFVVLYADDLLRWAGPVVLVAGLIMGMYSRRYSPLSSTVWSGVDKKRTRADSETQRKSLDEILDTLQSFTGRCEVILDPFLRLTEYLSTQSSATSATTRPALATMFIRILAFTPIWIALTLPPLRIITTKRLTLALGTMILTWHSRPARVIRAILWRSRAVRSTISLLTGLDLPTTVTSAPPLPPRPQDAEAAKKAGIAKAPGITFTFSIYENERRWWGLGWTKSLLVYERQAWTDDQLNECPPPSEYVLPSTERATTMWRWVKDSAWHVEGALTDKERSAKRIGGGGGGDYSGWVYYDNKWDDGRKEDGWGRYTRRRKWIRDAELVEIDPTPKTNGSEAKDFAAQTSSTDTGATPISPVARQRRGWFGRSASMSNVPTISPSPSNGAPATSVPNRASGVLSGLASTRADGTSTPVSGALPFKKPPRQSDKHKSVDAASISSMSVESTKSRGSAAEEDVHTPIDRVRQYDWDRSIGEGIMEQLS